MILRTVDLGNNYFLFFKYIYLTRITAIFTIIRKLLIRFMPHSTSSSILLAIASSFTKYMDKKARHNILGYFMPSLFIHKEVYHHSFY